MWVDFIIFHCGSISIVLIILFDVNKQHSRHAINLPNILLLSTSLYISLSGPRKNV